MFRILVKQRIEKKFLKKDKVNLQIKMLKKGLDILDIFLKIKNLEYFEK